MANRIPLRRRPRGGAGGEARSQAQRTRARFLRDRVNVAGLVVCVVFAVLAVASPLLERWGLIDPSTTHPGLVQGIGSLPTGPMGGISADHWAGVEPGTGRDLLSRIISGLTTSLTVATLATLLSVTIGTALGMIAGLSRGLVDWGISRLVDLVLSFPALLMLLTLAPLMTDAVHHLLRLPTGPPSQIAFMVLVLSAFGWPYIARIVRGQVLSLREQEFVEAARSLGARSWWIQRRELLPHLWAPILVYATLMLPTYVAAEATLGFLGVGIQAPAASLGSILNDSVSYAAVDPAYFLIPGGVLALIVLALNLVGDGLKDAMDPEGYGS
jgi:peptide/nickel transport system permease protein